MYPTVTVLDLQWIDKSDRLFQVTLQIGEETRHYPIKYGEGLGIGFSFLDDRMELGNITMGFWVETTRQFIGLLWDFYQGFSVELPVNLGECRVRLVDGKFEKDPPRQGNIWE